MSCYFSSMGPRSFHSHAHAGRARYRKIAEKEVLGVVRRYYVMKIAYHATI